MQTSTSKARGILPPQRRRVDKPWGWETVWAETPEYVGKLLHIEAGKRLSLQYHDEKLETQCLLAGRAVLVLEDNSGELHEVAMEAGKGYTVLPFRRHRLVALSDADVLEVSTPETGTTYRIEDDYARPHETEAMRREGSGPWARGSGDDHARPHNAEAMRRRQGDRG